jgi:hypothetical protein
MPHAPSRRASWAVALLVAACSDAPTVPLPPPIDALAAGLDVVFPSFDRDLLVTTASEVLTDSTLSRPAGVLADHDPPPEIEGDPVPEDARGKIMSAYTFVAFNTDHVYAQGDHLYQGNKSRIETTLNAWFAGERIGTQKGVKEQSSPFIYSFLQTYYIQAIARLYTSHTCGLSADASSEHSAWWEAVVGSPVSTFSLDAMSSFATRRSQGECPPPPPPLPPADGGGGGGGGMCWVNIWYDTSTGEIVDWDVLFCENAYGG